ncbi:MAG: hypothetical protein K5765_01150 [Clostridia bacterium]|nr:hypothetical protein [Clostridia bacterium]
MEKEFTLNMVKDVLKYIAEKNHFFVSEAHLQTEFTIAAAKLFPNNRYYPELVPSKVPDKYFEKFGEKGTHFDLLIKTNNQKVLIEFKYITNTYANIVDGMWLQVKSHMAMDIRRYDCWKDIERIELFSKEQDSDVDYGYFVLITNVPALWNQPGTNSLDAEFHIENGTHLAGTRNWRQGAAKGTTKGRENLIETTNDYVFKYDNFYNFGGSHGEFKSLVVEIE